MPSFIVAKDTTPWTIVTLYRTKKVFKYWDKNVVGLHSKSR